MASVRVTVYAAQAAREAAAASLEGRRRIAEQAAADARATAPVRTGAYLAGIGVEVSGDEVRIVNNDPDAIHKEYGTSDTPAHATMTNAARRYGRYTGMQPGRGRRR